MGEADSRYRISRIVVPLKKAEMPPAGPISAPLYIALVNANSIAEEVVAFLIRRLLYAYRRELLGKLIYVFILCPRRKSVRP